MGNTRYPGGLTASSMDVVHTAELNDDHALEIDVNAAGFGDVKALDIDYIPGAITATEEEAVILINIDDSATVGGDIVGLEVLAVPGTATIHALEAGAEIHPILQQSGTFGDMDSALVNSTDRLTEFLSTASNVQIFVADDDTVTIGDAAKFEELSFSLAAFASGGGVRPTFEYSTGSNPTTYAEFSPIDGTNGFRNSGVIAWQDAQLDGWVVDGNSEFLIRITRTRNNLGGIPTESKVQIAAVVEYSWDKDGDVKIKDVEVDGALNHDGATAGFYGATPTVQLTGVAVSAAGVHAALVTLGLITA